AARTPRQVDEATRESVVRQYTYDPARERVVFERGGDLYIQDLKSGTEVRLANTVQREHSPRFNHDGTRVFFQQGDNLFSVSVDGGGWTQLSNFARGDRGAQGERRSPESEQNKWLKADQLDLFDVLKARQRRDSLQEARRDNASGGQPRHIDIGNNTVSAQ